MFSISLKPWKQIFNYNPKKAIPLTVNQLFIHVREIFARFVRASLLQIFLATNQCSNVFGNLFPGKLHHNW